MHVISASRRTDGPAFYPQWLMTRLRAGFCPAPNLVHPGQVSRISLLRCDVDAVVFCTSGPRGLPRHLPEVDAVDDRYCFQGASGIALEAADLRRGTWRATGARRWTLSARWGVPVVALPDWLASTNLLGIEIRDLVPIPAM